MFIICVVTSCADTNPQEPLTENEKFVKRIERTWCFDFWSSGDVGSALSTGYKKYYARFDGKYVTFYANEPGSSCIHKYKSRYIIDRIDPDHVNNWIVFPDTVSQIWGGADRSESKFEYRFIDMYEKVWLHIWVSGVGGHGLVTFEAEEYKQPLPTVYSEYELCDSSGYNIWTDMVSKH